MKGAKSKLAQPLLIAFGLLSALLPSSARAEPGDAASGLTTARFLEYDRSNAPARPSVGGQGWRSPIYGIQVHESCFRYASKSEPDRARQIAAYGRWLDRTVSNMFGTARGCVAMYPELSQYFSDWVAHFRRTVITCSGKTGKELNAGAYHCSVPAHVRDGLLPSESNGIPLGNQESLARSYNTVVVLPRDAIEAVAASGADTGSKGAFEQMSDQYATELLTHEVFHSTGANNREDHNDVERVKVAPDFSNVCGDNVAVDRVNLLASLCTGSTGNLGKGVYSPNQLLLERMRRCGPEKGCISLFTSHYDDPVLPSYGTSRPAAIGACETIAEKQACQEYINAHVGAAFAQSTALSQVGQRVRARLEQVLPARSHQASAALLGGLGLKAGFESLKSSYCADALYRMDSAGNIEFIPESGQPVSEPYSTYGRAHFCEKGFWSSLSEYADRRLAGADPRCSGQTREAVRNLMRSLQDGARKAFSSTPHDYAGAQRFQGNTEMGGMFNTLHGELPLRRTADFQTPGAQLYRGVLGDELYNDYFHELERAHPSSNTFDCVSLGFHLKATIREASNTLELVIHPLPGHSCP